jgi:hypothetical protein
MKRSDIIIIVIVLVLAGIIYLRSAVPGGSGLTADIYVDGKLYKSMPITKEEKSALKANWENRLYACPTIFMWKFGRSA